MNSGREQMNNVKGRRQEIAFNVEVKDGIVQKIHNAYTYHPRIYFKGNRRKSLGSVRGK